MIFFTEDQILIQEQDKLQGSTHKQPQQKICIYQKVYMYLNTSLLTGLST
jgi:hypothetical protein